jgi:hypothetical protein
MSNFKLTKTYRAAADISARTIVAFSADRTVTPASAATDLLVGVSTEVDATEGDPVDIHREGLVEVIAGDTITRGQFVTADADGNAVPCAPAAGQRAQYIGIAEVSAAEGDIIDIMLVRGQLTTPAA